MLYAYPVDFPAAEVMQVVVNALRGIVPDAKHAFHCAWHAAGYGASLWEGSPLVVRGPATISDAEAADILEGKTVVSGSAASSIPWDLLLPVLIRLLERLLLPPTP